MKEYKYKSRKPEPFLSKWHGKIKSTWRYEGRNFNLEIIHHKKDDSFPWRMTFQVVIIMEEKNEKGFRFYSYGNNRREMFQSLREEINFWKSYLPKIPTRCSENFQDKIHADNKERYLIQEEKHEHFKNLLSKTLETK